MDSSSAEGSFQSGPLCFILDLDSGPCPPPYIHNLNECPNLTHFVAYFSRLNDVFKCLFAGMIVAIEQLLLLLSLIAVNLISGSLCCIGYSTYSSRGPSGHGFSPSSSASVAFARAAPNAHLNLAPGAEKCRHPGGYGAYRAYELRRMAIIHKFQERENNLEIPTKHDSELSCKFDLAENCAWYNGDKMQKPRELFRKARFEPKLFNGDKFGCTNERAFPLDGYFLMAGGQEKTVEESSAAIEVRVPCQQGNAMLKFDYWSINETPILKICVVPEETMVPLCEESKMDVNPLTFEIPQNLHPFRLRIQVDNIVGRDDIVLIDNINYEAKLCPRINTREYLKMATKLIRTTTTPKSLNAEIGGGEQFEIVDGEFDEQQKYRHEGTFDTVQQQQTMTGEQLELLDPVKDGKEDIYEAEDGEKDEKERINGKKSEEKEGNDVRFSSVVKAKKFLGQMADGPIERLLCAALECNFDGGDACEYELRGTESTSTWKVNNGPLGNPHTGIHKTNPRDPKLAGYVFAGSDTVNPAHDIFVLESPKITMDSPVLLVFDLFQRSVGPHLKVCLNVLNNCPYENPQKPDKSQHWITDQRVMMPRGTEKVFFVGSNLRQNLYIAIDNIRIQSMDFKELCAEPTGGNNFQQTD